MTTKMGEEARAYLYKRGLTDDVLKHFQIGLAPAERTYLYQRLADKFEEKDLLIRACFICQMVINFMILFWTDHLSFDQ